MYGDARMVKQGLSALSVISRASGRSRAWTHRPVRSVKFVGQGDPTTEWVYSVNGRAWIKLGAKGKDALIARHASFVLARPGPAAGHPHRRDGSNADHLLGHAYLIRYDKRTRSTGTSRSATPPWFTRT